MLFFLAILVIILFTWFICLCLWIMYKWEVRKEKQEAIIAKAKSEEAKMLKESRKKLENKISSIDSHDGHELFSANLKFDRLVFSIGKNVMIRPSANRPIQKSSAIRGGIVDGLFGPGAGVYTALKTEQENIVANERYQRQLKEKEKNIKETLDYYWEIVALFTKIVDIIKKNMSDKVPFLALLPSDYTQMYNFCYGYINSSNEDIKLCAQALVSYSSAMKILKAHH